GGRREGAVPVREGSGEVALAAHTQEVVGAVAVEIDGQEGGVAAGRRERRRGSGDAGGQPHVDLRRTAFLGGGGDPLGGGDVGAAVAVEVAVHGTPGREQVALGGD